MELPIRILDRPLEQPVIAVDGAWEQSGLALSHWPGNRTPPELGHELSTGIALNFARLPAARRAELARGCVAIANNHVDTDGICALFTVRHPGAALERERPLLEAAACGDLFRVASEFALRVDLAVAGLYDARCSPWRERCGGLEGRAWHEAVTLELVARFAELVDDGAAEFPELWRPGLEDLAGDRADLAEAQRDELVHLDVAVFTAQDGQRSRRPSAAGAPRFDPGRHAVFSATGADRALLVGPARDGATYRLIVNTSSWFDFQPTPRLPRPDLARLAAELDRLEGSAAGDELAWRAQDSRSPAPELWFGRAEAPRFAEHAPWLEPSRIAPREVKARVFEALRAAWSFPDDER
jgi:hypothetical protein